MIPINNESFNPEEIDYVPTIKPKNTTNTTNNTTLTNNTTDINNTIDKIWNDSEEWIGSWSD
ncbi:hypothetical protein [Methanobrevibacter sp. V14]|uniref:hypothetical protein n=1 Tax=Methanobrevibacter sp. V14 TaxID=3064280 RepID=UPI0027371461|nr:hypothetical protein [Methanobrevibacter sp. V14]